MTSVIIIELPDFIKQELLRLCLGLPNAEWQNEENLFIQLCTLGKLTDTERWDILDRLGEIQAVPFSLKICSLNFTPKRNHSGAIWVALEASQPFESLKKNIQTHLRTFKHHNHNHENTSSSETIHLGTVQRESPERMALYFETNGAFTSSIFDVNEFAIVQVHQTPKRSFYTVEKRYQLA
jgi:RNA 2',3'-cyclic 3'-phosphodiesterase